MNVHAILSSGCYPHQDLKGSIVAFKDIVNGKIEPYDDYGQGTDMAATALGLYGQGSDLLFYSQPAPDTKIVAVKVADKNGKIIPANLRSGIEWVIENKERLGINIVTLGSSPLNGEVIKEKSISQAIEKAMKVGLYMVVLTSGLPVIPIQAITIGSVDKRHSSHQYFEVSGRQDTVRRNPEQG